MGDSSTQFTADIYLADAANVGSYGVELALSGNPANVAYTYTEAAISGFTALASEGGISGFSSSTTVGGSFAVAGALIGSIKVGFATAPSSAFKLAVRSANLDNLDGVAMPVNWDTFALYGATGGTTPDTTPPAVTTFSPADEATSVAIGSNIVLTFNEVIAKGAGNIVLKTTAGAVVATYDAATSSNITISGSTLTINPTADLDNSTDYKVEFAAGSIKDLAGNSYAGTNIYNFTTAAASTTIPATGSKYYTTPLVKVGDSSTQFTADIYLADAANVGSYGVELALSGNPANVTYTYTEAAISGFTALASEGGISGFSSSTTVGGSFAAAGVLIGSIKVGFATAPSSAFKLAVVGSNLDDLNGTAMAVNWNSFESYSLGADTTAPTITTFSPADEATGVAIAANIVLTFSESVVARSGGTIELMTDYGSGHQSVEVFSVSDATRVTISGNVVTIGPTSALLPSTGYHLGFNSALADTAGNAFSYTHGQYNFTTAAANTAGKTADITAYSWKAHTLLSDVSVSNGALSHVTASDGAINFEVTPAATQTLTTTRAVPAAEASLTSSAVNLQDAIAILKMIVGLEVNGAGKPLSPYQALAADYDGNGAVQLTDAIGVLKHVVGLTAPQPTWRFVNELDTTVPAKANLSPGVPQAIISVNTSTGSSPVKVGLVGYLSGDVDGSFAGAAGALDLDITQASYFTALVTANSGLSLAQFGVY